MKTEKEYAKMEAARNKASDDYFKARPQLEGGHNRKIFESGFDRAWELDESKIINIPSPQKDWSPFNLALNTWRSEGRLSGMRYYFKSEADVIAATEIFRKMLQDAME